MRRNMFWSATTFLEESAVIHLAYYQRLMSLSCLEFRDFFIEGETRFFLKRINTITENEAIGAIRRIRKHIADGLKFYAKSQKMLEILSVIDNTLTQLQTDTLLHAFSTNHREDCMEFAVHLPFTACLQLVRKRLVELSEGVARVPCGGWRRQLLPTLFATQLRAACSSAAERGCLQSVLSDERLKGILQKLSAWFQNRSVGLKQNILRANNVDAHAHLFPPCQMHLYKTLRERHRLSHEPRRTLSLFLKDIGMPIEHAVSFWKREYSQKATAACSCQHSWQKDMRKLVYSIRHMYGLEGSRINYRAQSCKVIQDHTITANGEGGCPFVHFDHDRLRSCLSQKVTLNPQVLEEILSLSSEFPTVACIKHLTVSHLGNSVLSPHFTSPVQYYGCALKALKSKDNMNNML
ncbi:uncharacterized protein LOC126268225 isoform X2 [Schistocerca gregaria]|uniref:uncharacterized protein LOC126268225 isoform X2 n=1 Tax=Schistocerca gregaria TaxID=7010 RepID=UPI00211E60DE|nr:uncharacterized protein LOC126268225 isoform X2 [Schistocerca gregaria]